MFIGGRVFWVDDNVDFDLGQKLILFIQKLQFWKLESYDQKGLLQLVLFGSGHHSRGDFDLWNGHYAS